MRIDKVKKESHVYKMLDEYGWLFVHRYAWSHSNFRKITRRMCKDGKLVKISEDRIGFRYVRSDHNDTN